MASQIPSRQKERLTSLITQAYLQGAFSATPDFISWPTRYGPLNSSSRVTSQRNGKEEKKIRETALTKPMIPKVPHIFLPESQSHNYLGLAWVRPEAPIEVLGPTFIVHPSDPPRCVAFDSTRDRIALPALPSSDPPTSLAPTEVSHVWVITRVAGSPTVNLRTASGKFMSCDSHGVVSADREARGPQEEWTPVILPDTEPPMLAFQNSYDKYLSVDEVAGGALTLRGDSDDAGFNERFFVKVQYEYKKKATEEERKRNLAADLERGGKIDEAATKYVFFSLAS